MSVLGHAEGIFLTNEEAKVVRKVLSAVNTLYTVVEPEYKENKIDPIIRKIKEHENESE